MPPSFEVATLFLLEMELRNKPVRMSSEGQFVVRLDQVERCVDLDALSDAYEVNRDATSITGFVESLLATAPPVPTWQNAKKQIHFLAASPEEIFPQDFAQPVSEELSRCLVCVLPAEQGILWLSAEILQQWGQTQAAVEKIAAANLAGLVAKTKFYVRKYDKYQMGLFLTPSFLKASMIFSPNLKEIIELELGWPVLALLPCRDFLYLIPEKDADLLTRLKPVVISEYHHHAYPITTEILRLSDDGIQAIGRLGPPVSDQDDDLV